MVWRGYTPKSLGYVHLRPETPVEAETITIRLLGESTDKDAYSITELSAEPVVNKESTQSKKYQLGIVEIEFLEDIK